MTRDSVTRLTVIGLLLFITALFLKMIEQFLMAIFMAALLSAVLTPLHRRLTARLKGRQRLASALMLAAIVGLIVLPLSFLITMIVSQAIGIGQSVTPWVHAFISQPTTLSNWLEKLPFYDEIIPYRDQILAKAGELAAALSRYVINTLTDFSKVTVDAVFSTIIMLYVMFYFFSMGNVLLERILYFLPLDNDNERRLLNRFTSVTRATMKGTVIIGLMQGIICGIAFAVCDIKGPIFWGSLMAIASVIPAVGTALIWGPALLVMLLTGQYLYAAILVILCGLVAGNLDNIVRPRLVGKDTEMHDLFVLFGTLGGISMFGLLGIIVGPIVTALFITMWEIYGETFHRWLPKVNSAPQAAGKKEPATEQKEEPK